MYICMCIHIYIYIYRLPAGSVALLVIVGFPCLSMARSQVCASMSTPYGLGNLLSKYRMSTMSDLLTHCCHSCR